ncbi:MAG: nitroreductase [Thermoplasmata archaeon]|nr:nitroreductase [Thermoplasmata archaeon]
MDFIELAEKRYSVRKYQDRQVSKDDLDRVIRAAMLAPTGKNNQPFRIYVLQSKEAVAKMAGLSPCVFGAPTVLLFAYSRTEEWENPLEEGVHSGDQDVSIVATHAMMEAADIGLGTCWCNYFPNSEAEKVFGLPQNERVVLFMPIGYPAEDSAPSAMHSASRPVEEVVKYLRIGSTSPCAWGRP